MHLTIDGEPMGKQRPRFYNGHAITDKKTVNYETLVKEIFMVNKFEKLEGYIKAEIAAYYSIPKSTSNKKRLLMLDGEIRPTKKPDLDNIAKIILDSLNKLAYDDDSQIVDLSISKYYSDRPRVTLELNQIDNS